MIKLNKITADEIRVKIEAGDYNLKELLKDVDIQASLPYVVALYKILKNVSTIGNKEIVKVLPDELLKVGKTTKLTNGEEEWSLIYNHVIEDVITKYPKEDAKYLLDQYGEQLKQSIVDWGFPFLSKYKLTIEPL